MSKHFTKPIPLCSQEENPRGLHQRYIVTKADGSPVEPDAFYFVLRLDGGGDDQLHIKACRAAARAYWDYIRLNPGGGHLSILGCELQIAVEAMEKGDAEREGT